MRSDNTKDNSYPDVMNETRRAGGIGAAGHTVPVVDHNRCGVKRDCVRVCPTNVFEIRRIDPDDFVELRQLGKVRNVVHRRMTAYPVRADDCEACGLCVTACPEGAITLVERTVQ